MTARLLPSALFGLRTAVAGLLALYIAFRLQIDQPGWAATSAVIVAQPVLGASLRKGTFRLLGTVVGAAFAVLLYALFPQSRVGVLGGLVLWAGACSFLSTYLRDFSAYAAMLAGYTAAIVAMDAVGAPDGVFLLAVARASAIIIGIVCTTVVFSLTDRGHQRAELATRLEALARQTIDGLFGVLGDDREPMDRQRDRRRALLVQTAALDAVVDAAIGENYDLRARVGRLRAALGGLFNALSCWRAIERHARALPPEERTLPAAMRERLRGALPDPRDAGRWAEAGATLRAMPATTASERLVTDRLGDALANLARVQDALILLRDPARAPAGAEVRPVRVTDPLAACVNAARAMAVTGAACLIWVLTGWTAGPVFVIFAMVVVLLFVLRDEAAYGVSAVMAIGCAGALLAAGVAKFALLPLLQSWGYDGYAPFALVLGGIVFASGAASVALPQGGRAGAVAFATMANFMPMFSATNSIDYDYAGFLNTALATLAGATLGAAGYRWVPPLAPAWRIGRALAATRRDLRRLVAGRWRPGEESWEQRVYARLVQLPPQATAQQHAQLLAAMAIGVESLRARRLQAAAAGSPAAALRLEAARQEVVEAVASHPRYLSGLGV